MGRELGPSVRARAARQLVAGFVVAAGTGGVGAAGAAGAAVAGGTDGVGAAGAAGAAVAGVDELGAVVPLATGGGKVPRLTTYGVFPGTCSTSRPPGRWKSFAPFFNVSTEVACAAIRAISACSAAAWSTTFGAGGEAGLVAGGVAVGALASSGSVNAGASVAGVEEPAGVAGAVAGCGCELGDVTRTAR